MIEWMRFCLLVLENEKSGNFSNKGGIVAPESPYKCIYMVVSTILVKIHPLIVISPNFEASNTSRIFFYVKYDRTRFQFFDML